jgi:hypothetical protein
MSCVLVVGHNPGLTELVNRLLPDLALDNLPTSGSSRSIFRRRVGAMRPAASAKLAYYDYPKNPGADRHTRTDALAPVAGSQQQSTSALVGRPGCRRKPARARAPAAAIRRRSIDSADST